MPKKSVKQDGIQEYRTNGTKRYGYVNDPDNVAFDTREQAEQRKKSLDSRFRRN
ncbi:hypothetical protein [Streptomyces luteocolor]|uniref:hypothetical protein n=1 Tax=Streptomyces luteocolor TaxID=285500 RepID=UPI0013018289|nr:hypothetical protein [Streptomyces luteocolor]